jgi:leucyl-tRNA---protein transferase
MTRIMLLRPKNTHPCGYLDDRQAVSLYVDPAVTPDLDLLTRLSLNGFRRSGLSLYRPDCPGCNACISIRLSASEFVMKRRFRRTLKSLSRWQLAVEHPSTDYYPLFERYINIRHHDGSMYPPSPEQFHDFLFESFGNTRFLVARDKGVVIAVLVFDILSDGLSSVYCFFEPELEGLSPGSYMILRLTQICQGLDLPWHYLGYWVEGCHKMEYKEAYQPLEYLINNRWQRK